MHKILLFTLLLFSNIVSAQAISTDFCLVIKGAKVIASDGTYLGLVTGAQEPDSILNPNGLYGSKYNSRSIWNPSSSYGGEYSSKSPFNPYTSTPPKLMKDGKSIGYLTLNTKLENAVTPYFVQKCSFY